MKVISYSLFRSNAARFEFLAYLRGFYLNCRMNNLIMPAQPVHMWITHLELELSIYEEYKNLFDWLVQYNLLNLTLNEGPVPLCEGMLWRMKPIFTTDITHVLCRDADAITTYREAYIVQQWIESGVPFHLIHDNPGHGGFMGGMMGFDTAAFKAHTGINSFKELLGQDDLSRHGSDQDLLNQRIAPAIGNNFLWHTSKPGVPIEEGLPIPTIYDQKPIPNVDPKYWESNLCSSFIGSAGFNELETIRFLRRFDSYQWKHEPIEKEFKNIFYWWM